MLGIAWAVLNPLIMLSMYVYVFGFIFGGTFGVLPNESRWDYGLGIFLGLSVFHTVAECIGMAPSVIVGNPNFVKKIVFPLEILPASVVLSAVIHMLITIPLIVVGLKISGHSLTIWALLFPIVLVALIGYTLGLCWFLSAIGVFFRDIGVLVNVVVTALMFASAIFYPAARIAAQSPAAWQFLRFNPVLQCVELSRCYVLWGQPGDLLTLCWLVLGSIATAFLGFACFYRLKPAFADVI